MANISSNRRRNNLVWDGREAAIAEEHTIRARSTGFLRENGSISDGVCQFNTKRGRYAAGRGGGGEGGFEGVGESLR